MSHVSLIVARAQNGTIGLNGTMPWHLPEDLRHFKTVTMGHPVIMGRVTHESIGRPLPGRTNIVVSRRADYRPQGCLTACSIEEALKLVPEGQEPFILGGAKIYAQALPLVDTCWVTQIGAAIEGDAFFPDLDPSIWKREVLSELAATESRPSLTFCVYRRKA